LALLLIMRIPAFHFDGDIELGRYG
jgi:hypothetical protein